jgi:transposase-like protein
MNCKFCQSKNLIKKGFTKLNKRVFLCKDCKKYQISGQDNRKKYDEKIIQTAFILFSEGNNYRRIARILSKIFNKKISYQLIIHWIQKEVDKMPENISKNAISSDIEIVEMDELWSFFKKKVVTSEYGLLLTETATVCLHLGSAQAMKFRQEEFGTKYPIIK